MLHYADIILDYRNKFDIPIDNITKKEVIYLCGNSLGLKPKNVNSYILKELSYWSNLGVEGHFKSENPWLSYHKNLGKSISKIIGANYDEVVVMNSLSVNLHLLLVSFYKPTKDKFKILIEKGAFPSDNYIVDSQAKFHGYNPNEAIIEIPYKDNSYYFSENEIILTIEKHRDELALILLSGVNYYTGQAFNLKKISEIAKKYGIIIGFDLAHAIGNISLSFKEYNVDFATWCSYKYLNSGPGGVSGVYINKKHFDDFSIPRFEGWWGHKEIDRFEMKRNFTPSLGAEAWQLSNAPILSMAAHASSLAIFEEVGMEKLLEKSKKMHFWLRKGLEKIINTYPECIIEIITPKNEGEYGCQISLLVNKNGKELFDFLNKNNVISDWRNPNVIRIAPVPLYNTFEEIADFLKIFEDFFLHNF